MASTDSKKKKSGKNPTDRLRPTSVKAWNRTGKVEEDVLLPSGNVARLRRVGPAAILRSGIMPDSLMPIINKAIKEGKGEKIEESLDIEDPETLTKITEGMDKALLEIVAEPAVAYHLRPVNGSDVWEVIPDSDRDIESFIYTDEVDMQDKMFIFNYAVGGTRDLESFREQHAERVGSLAHDAGDGDPAE
jgi:hypothetical protein